MPHSAPLQATIDIDWPVPNIELLNEHDGKLVTAVVKWKQITSPFKSYNNAYAQNEGYHDITYRVLKGTSSKKCKLDSCRSAEDIVNSGDGKTYLAPHGEFKIGLATGCDQTCFKIQALYNITKKENGLNDSNSAKSEYSDIICVQHPPDLYCQRTNGNFTIAKTQNNVSSRRRYAQAIKNIRAARSYTGTYVGGWGGKKK